MLSPTNWFQSRPFLILKIILVNPDFPIFPLLTKIKKISLRAVNEEEEMK